VAEALKDPSPYVRLAAALAHWKISGRIDESFGALRKLHREGKGLFRLDAILTMREIEKTPEQLAMLVSLLQDREDLVRERTANVLHFELEGEADAWLPLVRPLTKHPSHPVRGVVFDLLDWMAIKQQR
jgi:HEAT repeat protein